MKIVLMVAMFIQLISFSILAQTNHATFGSEFEFTDDSLEIRHIKQGLRGTEKVAAKKMAKVIKDKCVFLGCTIEEINYKWGSEFKVRFSDGKWFVVSYDPLVIEVIVNPMTLDEWKNRKELLDEIIFRSAEQAGYVPTESRAGHHNMGVLSVFGDNAELFLKFYVDYANHAELASGVLRENWKTAAPLFALGEKPALELQKIVDEFYNGQHQKIHEIVEQITRRVLSKHITPDWWTEKTTINQAMNLRKITKSRLGLADQPLETRAIRAQKNVEEFILTSELLLARINFLKKSTDRISVRYFDPRKLTDKEKLNLFSKYVNEAGLDIISFFKMVPGLYLHTLKTRLQANVKVTRLYEVGSCSNLF